MHPKHATLGLACVMALVACGDRTPPPATDAPATPAPATTPASPDGNAPAPGASTGPDPMPAPQPQDGQPGQPGAGGKPEATVQNCSTTIEGNDAMQFNVGSITVPSSCSEFTITLRHTGALPVNTMGHNVVIALASDRTGVATDGMAAGADAAYVKPGDTRVVAHSELIGGGGTTSVSFPVSAIQGGGPYEFFCSFPGHWAMMHGTIQVGG